MFKHLKVIVLRHLVAVAWIPVLILAALFSRILNKRKGIGLGPEPLINNLHHKKALELVGYKAETFVTSTYFITKDFDKVYRFPMANFVALCRAFFRYEAVYIYFNGFMCFRWTIFEILEPLLLNLAGVKAVVMPYGSDVQDLTAGKNLLFKNSVTKDYPLQKFEHDRIRIRVSMWEKYAHFVISGCDWVDYMTHWDQLMLAHFSIDLKEISPNYPVVENRPFRILHAPNHRSVKGTQHFLNAVEELKDEGYEIELELVEGVSNSELMEKMKSSDIILDQLIVGWYAMTAIEAMSLGKPVFCYVREDLLELYKSEGLVPETGLPLISVSIGDVKETLRKHLDEPFLLYDIGIEGRKFVEENHSTESISEVFKGINLRLGL